MLALALSCAAPVPVQAASPEQAGRVALQSELGPGLSLRERQALEVGLSLPAGAWLSPEFIGAALPAWREILAQAKRRAASERDPAGPWHRAAAHLKSLQVATAKPSPPVPGLRRFDIARYRSAVGMLAGQQSRPWPGKPGRTARFTNRLMGHPDNELGAVADYLADYYRGLGLAVEHHQFKYEGRAYRNVIATIPGESREQVVLADHFDVAPTADYGLAAFGEAGSYGLSRSQIDRIRATHRTGWPVPGADDNASATAALLEAAHMLASGPRPGKTIRLLHLNGEEFPGDSLGAKEFVARSLARKDPIVAVVVLDMIGVNRNKDRVFQIAPGQGDLSIRLADHAARAASRVASGYKPVVRLFDDHGSYLYNTDAQVFSTAGYPVILLNEHLNYHKDLERLGYHDEFDRTELMDWPYARAIASTGIAAALMAAADMAIGPGVASRLAAMQVPERRVSHFQIELRYSPLFEAVESREKALGRSLTDAELGALIRADLAVGGDPAHHDSSMARRLTSWFPQAGWAPMDFGAIAGEIRYLQARDRYFSSP